MLYRLILKTEYSSWCSQYYMCVYVCLWYFHLCNQVEDEMSPYKLWNLLSGDCSQHYLKQPLFFSGQYQILLHLFCFIFGIVYWNCIWNYIHFVWLVFLEFLSSFLFFFLHRGEHLDTITKGLLSIIGINHTVFFGMLLGTLWLLTLIWIFFRLPSCHLRIFPAFSF